MSKDTAPAAPLSEGERIARLAEQEAEIYERAAALGDRGSARALAELKAGHWRILAAWARRVAGTPNVKDRT